MKKIDPAVARESLYIAACTAILSALMEAVFLIIGRWDYTVLTGNLLGYVVSVLNFFFMGITVQKAVTKDEKAAANTMKFSQTVRTFAIVVLAALGILLDFFNTVAVIVPLFFPRIAVAFRPLFGVESDRKSESADTPTPLNEDDDNV